MPDRDERPTAGGLDAQAIGAMTEAIRQDAARGRMALTVATEWAGRARSVSTVRCCTIGGEEVCRDVSIVADEPSCLLGENSAPSPLELLLSALNACMVMGYVTQAALRGIALEACRIETDGELDLRGFFGLDEQVPAGNRRISYTVHLDGDGTREQLEEIHQAVMATSPNFFNLAQPIQMCGRLA